MVVEEVTYVELPKRPGPRPETTTGVPHHQIDVEPVAEVNEELFQRVYSIPGIEHGISAGGGWDGLWLKDGVPVSEPDALLNGREFAHIHGDGSLHIFLKPSRGQEAVDSCWAVFHPYAIQYQELLDQLAPWDELEPWEKWDGYMMLYTPQSIEELNVTFQLIVDGYNYVTGENEIATDYY